MDDASRFWSKVQRGDDCWLWTGSRNGDGYGRFGVNGSNARAHRVAWELENGPIPEAVNVLHRCDNPPCVRPSHLFLGTQLDNVRDCADKGRRGITGGGAPAPVGVTGPHGTFAGAGESAPRARLTASDVATIRARHASGASQVSLAHAFDVSTSNIHLIVTNRRWTNKESI